MVGFGVEAQAAGRRAGTADVVRRDGEPACGSATGVDVDEEMTLLLQFQRADEGAARVIQPTLMDFRR